MSVPGTMTLAHCTLNGNTLAAAPRRRRWPWNNGTTTLTNCTVSGNSALHTGGGVVGNGQELRRQDPRQHPRRREHGHRCSESSAKVPWSHSGNNLIGKTDGSSGWVGSDLTGTVAAPLDPLLAPLGNYGGPTQTMALLPGSPAIDAGNNALIPAGVTTDQRGLPRIVNTVVDIGAFESSGFTIAVTSGSGQSTGVLTAFPAPLVATVTANNPSEPVAGGLVTFTPPASGASATLSGSPATIGATGTASVTATANGIVGSYTVTATASGITTPASFSLTNVPATLVVNNPTDTPVAGEINLPPGHYAGKFVHWGQHDHLRPDRVRHPANDHPGRHPALIDQHDGDGDDHRPGGGRDDQRKPYQQGVPGRRECHGVDLGTHD